MNKRIYFLVAASAALAFLCFLPSCKKAHDFIRDHPDDHDTICRLTNFDFLDGIGQRVTMQISYNARGNPVDMVQTLVIATPFNQDRHFRYDRFGRLTAFITNYARSTAATGWHKYAYPRKDYITDTMIQYNGPIDGPAPNASLYIYSVNAYKMDKKGRIGTILTLSLVPGQPPTSTLEMNYDANGNLVPASPDIVYDNKVNIYRTNKVWQFLYNDYSRNNPYFFNQAVLTYNDLGLPLALPNLRQFGYDLFGCNLEDGIFNGYFNIGYACSVPKGPIGY